MRRLVSEKESLTNQDILSLSIKFSQWAQNAMEALPEGAIMTCHGTQASPRLLEVSVVYVFFFSPRSNQCIFLIYCAETKVYMQE